MHAKRAAPTMVARLLEGAAKVHLASPGSAREQCVLTLSLHPSPVAPAHRDAVAVVADRWWTAKQAVDLLPICWSYGPNHDVSSAKITDSMREGLDTDEIDIGREDGDVDRALATAAKRIEAIYTVPYLSHATMEPQNCTARLDANGVEGWAPTQDPESAVAIAASVAGVPRDRVVVHRTTLGAALDGG